MTQKTETAAVVTSIFGYNENSGSGGKAKNSAIPRAFDNLFHGDFRTAWPSSRSSALGTKSLEEYPNRTFPNYRARTGLKITFETNGTTISSYSVTQDRNLAPITLEGGPGEPNPLRSDFGFLDGSQNYLPANQKGPYTKSRKVGPIGGIEGVRGSIIFGGNDTYLVKLKQAGYLLPVLFPVIGIPLVMANYYLNLPAFYAFLDFVFMADGTKLVRIWDASVYPAQSLYVGSSRQDKTDFRENTEWSRDGSDPAFGNFVNDSLWPDRTPFSPLAPLNYKNAFGAGHGEHPVMEHKQSGTTLSVGTVENQLSSPLVPSLL